jgi:predicted nucleotidyltransferase
VIGRPLVTRVAEVLGEHGVAYAVIGAAALAAHGVARSTFDVDLFTTSQAPLEHEFWSEVAADSELSLAIRRGDADDPLQGLVRVEAPDQRTVDVVIGRRGWMSEAVARAAMIRIAGSPQPVITAPDLVLFKLYAGGSQDCWDIEQLLAGSDRDSLAAAVDAGIAALPVDARRLWQRLRPTP